MNKIKVNFEDGEREVEMKPVKGKHIKQLWTKLNEFVSNGNTDLKGVMIYNEFIDNLTCELTGLTIDELDELDMDEKKKLTSQITKHMHDLVDFPMP